MESHPFIWQPGEWLGEGVITFSEASDRLRFYTRWEIKPEENGVIAALQSIEVESVPEKMENSLLFADFDGGRFSVELDNQLLGCIYGSGLVDGEVVGWEFRADDQQGVEGFEVYELQEGGDYSMRAEYVSADQFRTIIEGRVWKAD